MLGSNAQTAVCQVIAVPLGIHLEPYTKIFNSEVGFAGFRLLRYGCAISGGLTQSSFSSVLLSGIPSSRKGQ